MPYIAVNTAKALSQSERETVKSELGKLIRMLPNKSERVLMVDFCGGREIWLGGVKRENGAFVDVRLWGACEPEAKKKFTEAVFSMLEKNIGSSPDSAYLTIGEYANWGSGGTLK